MLRGGLSARGVPERVRPGMSVGVGALPNLHSKAQAHGAQIHPNPLEPHGRDPHAPRDRRSNEPADEPFEELELSVQGLQARAIQVTSTTADCAAVRAAPNAWGICGPRCSGIGRIRASLSKACRALVTTLTKWRWRHAGVKVMAPPRTQTRRGDGVGIPIKADEQLDSARGLAPGCAVLRIRRSKENPQEVHRARVLFSGDFASRRTRLTSSSPRLRRSSSAGPCASAGCCWLRWERGGSAELDFTKMTREAVCDLSGVFLCRAALRRYRAVRFVAQEGATFLHLLGALRRPLQGFTCSRLASVAEGKYHQSSTHSHTFPIML